MLDAIYKEARERMTKSVDAVLREFGVVRTGTATVQLLDTVKVEAYGTTTPLNQVATITVPEPRLLVVQAFDKGTVGEIVKGIQKADLGFNPVVDGQIIRVPVPSLNEERRKELVRHCHNIAEEGRIAIRNIRRDANDQIKNAQKDKEISEDQERDGHDEIQKMTDEFTAQVDAQLETKEKSVLEV